MPSVTFESDPERTFVLISIRAWLLSGRLEHQVQEFGFDRQTCLTMSLGIA